MNTIKRAFIKVLLKQNLSIILFFFVVLFLSLNTLEVFISNSKHQVKTQEQIEENIVSTLAYNSKVYFIYNTHEFFGHILIEKDKKDYYYTNLPIRSLQFYEEESFKRNLKYEWFTLNKIVEKFPDKEIIKNLNTSEKSKPLIVSELNVIGNVFLVLLVIFILEKSGMLSLGFLDKKFSIYFPNEIEGDINDLIGLDEIKHSILSMKTMIDKNQSIKCFNILFSGPPGTGKTKMAAYLAKELNLPLIVGTGNVETGYVAGGANTIKSLFKAANTLSEYFDNKCIIFLDEAQVLLKARNNQSPNSTKWDDDATNELLSNLDGVNTKIQNQIIFIAASNFDDTNFKIDDAIERRFQQKLYFSMPVLKERILIIESLIEKLNLKKQLIDVDYIAEVTQGLSPAKIETIFKETLLQNQFHNDLITTQRILKEFENIMIGYTTKNITEEKEKERNLIVIHELGHFFCYLDSLAKKYEYNQEEIIKHFNVLKISSESIAKYNVLGYVLNIQDNIELKSIQELENEIIKLYGGVAAENIFYTPLETTIGSYNDIEKITDILNLLIMKLNVYSQVKINYMRLYNGDNTLLEKQHLLIEQKAEELYGRSIEIVEKYKKDIEILKDILMKRWSLNKNELIELIENNTIILKK